MKVGNLYIVTQIDTDPDLSFLQDESRYAGVPRAEANKYIKQDQERLASYSVDWEMLGIHAEAEILVGGTLQHVRTGGLWGVESDSASSYLNEVAREEYANLVDILAEMGIPKSKIPKFETAEKVSRES